MPLNKQTVCNHCSAEFEIEALEDFLILYCPACGKELEVDDPELEESE